MGGQTFVASVAEWSWSRTLNPSSRIVGLNPSIIEVHRVERLMCGWGVGAESVPEADGIGHLIEEVADLARQINSQVDGDDVQELLDSHN
ncbi:hypothetical protein TNCV_1262821 [Trichonephila clavipes]|nr:hypothetical protein TNCV_1262821 [Trichonephila clavipes]